MIFCKRITILLLKGEILLPFPVVNLDFRRWISWWIARTKDYMTLCIIFYNGMTGNWTALAFLTTKRWNVSAYLRYIKSRARRKYPHLNAPENRMRAESEMKFAYNCQPYRLCAGTSVNFVARETVTTRCVYTQIKPIDTESLVGAVKTYRYRKSTSAVNTYTGGATRK